MPLQIKPSSGSGSITLQATTGTTTNDTLTLPAKTGNIITSADTGTVTGTMLAAATVAQSNLATNVAGTGPAFCALVGSPISVSNTTQTKATFAAEAFDKGNNYSSDRFTAPIAGCYQFSVSIQYTDVATSGFFTSSIYKNNINYIELTVTSTSPQYVSSFSSIMLELAAGDYIEVYMLQNTGSAKSMAGKLFCGSLIRSA